MKLNVKRTLLAKSASNAKLDAQVAWALVDNAPSIEQAIESIKNYIDDADVVSITKGNRHYSEAFDYVTMCNYVKIAHPNAPENHAKLTPIVVSVQEYAIPSGFEVAECSHSNAGLVDIDEDNHIVFVPMQTVPYTEKEKFSSELLGNICRVIKYEWQWV